MNPSYNFMWSQVFEYFAVDIPSWNVIAVTCLTVGLAVVVWELPIGYFQRQKAEVSDYAD
jgi:hypothetical protein